jgi:hypothetical protein
VAQLYPRVLGSLFVASYDSQGYGGGIPPPHGSGSGCIDPLFLYLGTSWRRVVSLTHRPLLLWGKGPRYPLDRRLDIDDVDKLKFFTFPGLNSDPSVVQPAVSRYTDCSNVTSLF